MERGIAGEASAHRVVKVARGDAVWPFLFTGPCIRSVPSGRFRR